MIYIILIILNIIILSSAYIICKRKLQQKIEFESKKYIQENKQILESQISRQIDGLKLRERELSRDVQGKWKELETVSEQIAHSNNQLRQVNDTLQTQRERAKNYEAGLRELAEETAKTYEQDLMKIADTRVAEAKAKMQQEAKKQHEELMAQFGEKAAEMNEQLSALTKEINEYSAKQAAINEAIMRQRALEEQQDFYRICLAPEAKSDINYLISIIPNLKNPTTLYKLIWSEYIQKQFNQMLKNVLGATDPRNVIYSITNLKTNEIYIGKTKAEVSKRWSEHIKSSLNIGTIKSAKIHEALYNHWDEFVFAIIEKVPLEENLSMREKFYIDFYQSNIYGYNLKSGG